MSWWPAIILSCPTSFMKRGLFGLKKFPFIILHGGLLDTILEQIDRVLKVNSLLAAGERR